MRKLATVVLALLALGTVTASSRCRLVRTATTTPGCYGYVGYADGVRIGWFRRFGAYVRAGSAANCLQGGYGSVQIGPDAVRLEDGVRLRLDAHCENGQEF